MANRIVETEVNFFPNEGDPTGNSWRAAIGAEILRTGQTEPLALTAQVIVNDTDTIAQFNTKRRDGLRQAAVDATGDAAMATATVVAHTFSVL